MHKQVRNAGRGTVLVGLLDGNRGTISASPSRTLVVALQSLWTAALPGASRLLLARLLRSWNSHPHVQASSDGPFPEVLYSLSDFGTADAARDVNVICNLSLGLQRRSFSSPPPLLLWAPLSSFPK